MLEKDEWYYDCINFEKDAVHLTFVHPWMTVSDARLLFTDAFERYNNFEYSYTSANSNFSREHWDEFYESSKNLVNLNKKSNVLEIGCNDCYLLNKYKSKTLNLYGIDAGINYKIVYSNLLKNINILFCSNKNCLVYTMAFPIYLNLINYQKLLNNNNQIMYNNNICYCIHQYDRLDDIIKKQISNKYNLLI